MHKTSQVETEKLLNEQKKGILYWYPFKEEAKILLIENQETQIKELFQTADVCQLSEFENHTCSLGKYDYIIAVHVVESLKNLDSFFIKCNGLLDVNGKLLFAMDNRLGFRYFCGDRDPYTERNFDSIENYRRVSNQDLDKMSERALDSATVENSLKKSGFRKWQRLSVLPNIDIPQLIYAQDYLPEEDLSLRYFPMYNCPDTVFLEEQFIYDSLIQNDMFHQMANGYLFECTIDGELTDVKHVTLSMDRGETAAMATVIGGNKKVYKKALYSEGMNSLKQLEDNHADLRVHGISVVDGVYKNGMYEMPYIEAEHANVYLQNLLRRDKNAFILEIDKLRDLILQSSEHVEPVLTEYEVREVIDTAPIQDGVWLKKGYFDLVPLNAFYVDGEYIFFDQEFYIENYPANVMLVRTLDIIYGNHSDLENILPRTFFWERYDMADQVDYLRRKSSDFLYELRNQKKLRIYNENHMANLGVIHSNRQRMNFSADEYQKLFVNIFENLENYKVFLFGSGNFAKKFMDLYGSRYSIEGILDNNASRWGEEMNGVPICSPEVLETMEKENCKVIICIKSYLGVWKQLKDMNVKNIGIYDTNIIYPAVKTVQIPTEERDTAVQKKYKVGYVAGVFDLYHIGHLNMFKRAKEQCEYLIVGVVSDEAVRKNKKTVPFIPFEERIEMVRSCKYVDEAVEIPPNFGGTRDAYRLYHFDVQFSGSDYENDPVWLAEREYLRKHGSDLVFFPYTEQTSSTKIKALINKQLEEK